MADDDGRQSGAHAGDIALFVHLDDAGGGCGYWCSLIYGVWALAGCGWGGVTDQNYSFVSETGLSATMMPVSALPMRIVGSTIAPLASSLPCARSDLASASIRSLSVVGPETTIPNETPPPLAIDRPSSSATLSLALPKANLICSPNRAASASPEYDVINNSREANVLIDSVRSLDCSLVNCLPATMASNRAVSWRASSNTVPRVAILPWRSWSMDCCTTCSFRLFHHARKLYTASPTTPTPTMIANTRAPRSIFPKSASSTAFLESNDSSVSGMEDDDYSWLVFFGVAVVIIGLTSLVFPLMILIDPVKRRKHIDFIRRWPKRVP